MAREYSIQPQDLLGRALSSHLERRRTALLAAECGEI
jgi:hypothetical protein